MEDKGEDDLTNISSVTDAQLPRATKVIRVTKEPNSSTSNPVIIVKLFISGIIAILVIAGYFLGVFDNPEDRCLACLIFPLFFGSYYLVPQSEIVIIDDIESK